MDKKKNNFSVNMESHVSKNYPNNVQEAQTFLNMYVLSSYFYIGMRLIQGVVSECVNSKMDYDIMSNDFLTWDELSIDPIFDSDSDSDSYSLKNFSKLQKELMEPDYDFIEESGLLDPEIDEDIDQDPEIDDVDF
jgi:hypothetical protein